MYMYTEREKQLYRDINQHPTDGFAWSMLSIAGLAVIAIISLNYIVGLISPENTKNTSLTMYLIAVVVGGVMFLVGLHKGKGLNEKLHQASLKRYGE